MCNKWYDPIIDKWNFGPKMNTIRHRVCAALVTDNLVFAVGGLDDDATEPLSSVDVLDLSLESLCWKQSVEMLVERHCLGVGVIDNYLYAVGGYNNSNLALDNAEVFDNNTQEWRIISSMSTARSDLGVGVLNNLLYADLFATPQFNFLVLIHGHQSQKCLKCQKCREGVGVGVLDGLLYAVGGKDGSKTLSSVEAYRPSTGVWSTIVDMHKPRKRAGVVVLNGLLYVIGRIDDTFFVRSTEFYSPETKTWTIVEASQDFLHSSASVVAINSLRHFNTY
ncbi:ring canal kelch homolog [Acyrthosiphon pisum]|uniref:Uncharacterized protein n=1 Tax=Acyrthosiphon pisum TaxID=7029 RepID=A0A8R2B4B1_ACYPI|nr:ring canal kelch homolog [Acyrthosiphon pisum]|eukprot:XP_008181140.1 PREDICTED: ring canal kelch homolog [Acyrthosiphon pisum]